MVSSNAPMLLKQVFRSCGRSADVPSDGQSLLLAKAAVFGGIPYDGFGRQVGANCHGINNKFMCSSAFVPICTSKRSICIYRHSRPQQSDGQYCSILESHPDDLIQPFSSLTFYGVTVGRSYHEAREATESAAWLGQQLGFRSCGRWLMMVNGGCDCWICGSFCVGDGEWQMLNR